MSHVDIEFKTNIDEWLSADDVSYFIQAQLTSTYRHYKPRVKIVCDRSHQAIYILRVNLDPMPGSYHVGEDHLMLFKKLFGFCYQVRIIEDEASVPSS